MENCKRLPFCKILRFLVTVYGGEVDCYQSVNGKQKYIELKTSREIETPNQDRNFKRQVEELCLKFVME